MYYIYIYSWPPSAIGPRASHCLPSPMGRACRGGPATCTVVAVGSCTAPADARLLAVANKRRQRAAGPQRRLGGAARRKEHGEGTGLRVVVCRRPWLACGSSSSASRGEERASKREPRVRERAGGGGRVLGLSSKWRRGGEWAQHSGATRHEQSVAVGNRNRIQIYEGAAILPQKYV